MSRQSAQDVIRVLQAAGHEAVLAGGCVRDRLLGIEPADHDVATSAVPEQIEALFERTVPVGRRFGVVIVNDGATPVEVATFRADGDYKDGRRPESVRFSGIDEDALRRDFTINAMFEEPATGRIIDLVGGRNDLAAGLVRAVGDPRVRFDEDRLRILRAVRFAARFDFRIHDDTAAAIRADAGRLSAVSAERVGDEIAKILTDGRARRGFELLDETGLLEVVLPEMMAMKGCEQPSDQHPEGDVFIHTLACLGHLPRGCTLTLALGVLLHDIAKPRCAALREGRHTFHGHTHAGAEMAADICRRLRYSNAVTERVVFLVDQHLRHCSAPGMKTSTLKRFLRQDGIEELLELTRIDALGSSGDLAHYRFCKERLADLPREVMRPPRLLTGRDLIDLGLAPGPEFGRLLTLVEDAQLEGRISSREEALELVRRVSEGLQVGE